MEHCRRFVMNSFTSPSEALLADSAEVLEAFRVSLTALFAPLEVAARRRAAGPLRRRPPISLRLIAEGEPPAKLVVLPHATVYGRRGQRAVRLDCARMDCDLVDTDSAGKSHVRLRVGLSPCAAHISWERLVGAADDARRVVETVRDFITDRRAVLARCHDHCCVCGRGLTDELSRGRGIGPECVQHCHHFLERGQLVREMTVEDVFREEIDRHPEDTSTPLIYADWLEEHGREPEASLIRRSASAGGGRRPENY
jgi:uncharacterized protein (TIGR02996 family)